MNSDKKFGACESNGALCIAKKLDEQLNVIITFQRVKKYLICECVCIINIVHHHWRRIKWNNLKKHSAVSEVESDRVYVKEESFSICP